MIWFALAIAAGIFIYFGYGLHVIGLLPRNIGQHFDGPEKRWAWAIRLVAGAAGLAGVLDLVWYGGTLFYNDFSVEMIVGSFTVLFLDSLYRQLSRAEYKKQIIRQMASFSNDFALDAVRIARDEKWLKDGSLRRANLGSASLQGVNLEGADLQGAVLYNARLQEARLVSINLQEAILGQAHLQGSILILADLQKAYLGGTRLQGARLENANLRGANIQGAKYDQHTIWPDGFDPVAAGAILTDVWD